MNKSILEYLKSGIEPIPDSAYGNGYRCSAYLTDGTYLPCVMLRESSGVVKLAVRRFEQEKTGKGNFRFDKNGYETIVKHFVASGNRVNHYDIAKGEVFGLLGPNDAGKTTTMRIILDIFRSDQGQITRNGTPLGEVPRSQ
jgi:translation initiation factor RLI1